MWKVGEIHAKASSAKPSRLTVAVESSAMSVVSLLALKYFAVGVVAPHHNVIWSL